MYGQHNTQNARKHNSVPVTQLGVPRRETKRPTDTLEAAANPMSVHTHAAPARVKAKHMIQVSGTGTKQPEHRGPWPPASSGACSTCSGQVYAASSAAAASQLITSIAELAARYVMCMHAHACSTVAAHLNKSTNCAGKLLS